MTTSTRSTMIVGMKFRSPASAGSSRWPSISTRFRFEPRLRRLTWAVPSDPFESNWVASEVTWGRLFRTLSMVVAPCALISLESTVVTGLSLFKFGRLIRVPVTTTVCGWAVSPLAVAWAPAGRVDKDHTRVAIAELNKRP